MTVGYRTEDLEETRLVHMRNVTIPIGCACVMDATLRLGTLTQHFVEKRSKTTKRRKFSYTHEKTPFPKSHVNFFPKKDRNEK